MGVRGGRGRRERWWRRGTREWLGGGGGALSRAMAKTVLRDPVCLC